MSFGRVNKNNTKIIDLSSTIQFHRFGGRWVWITPAALGNSPSKSAAAYEVPHKQIDQNSICNQAARKR